MKKKLSIIITYSIGHFYIDFVCAYVFSLLWFKQLISPTLLGGLIILYNVIAFGSQPIWGFLMDYYKKSKEGAIVGLLLTTFGIALFFEPLLATIALSIGNAIYHAGGGIVALNLEPSKAKYPGIYVAPGALGLFFGAVLGRFTVGFNYVVIGIIIVCCVLVTLISKLPKARIEKYKNVKNHLVSVILLLLLVSVCMRALIGFSLCLGWKSLFCLGLLLTTAIAAGKFFGGFLADKYGFMRVGIAGLLVAAPLLIFFQAIPWVVYIGVFCFNLVMPITLTAVAEALPNYKGFAFGLTTLALIVGYMLFLILKNNVVVGQVFTTIVISVNLISLYFGLKDYNKIKVLSNYIE